MPSTTVWEWVWRNLRGRSALILRTTITGSALALVIAFLLPNEYRSSATLMPPEQQAFNSVSALAGLSGQIPVLSGGGLLNAKSPGAIPVGILASRTMQDDIVNQFDLRRVYRKSLYETTRIRLAKNTRVEEDRKSGIVVVEVTDRDPYRARDMVRAYISNLNAVLNRVSTSSARREREFLEARVSSIKQSLDEGTRTLSEFSSKNATLDYQKQGQATLAIAGKLQAELITAQAELSALQAVFTDDNVQVQIAKARIAQLKGQLQKMIGKGPTSADSVNAGEFPSIRQLPLLGVTYADLMRKVTVDEALYGVLEKQYELARVQEAKEIPVMKVLDEANVPERKSFPPRMGFGFLGGLLGALAACTWVLLNAWRAAPFYMVTTAAEAENLENVANVY